MSGFFGFIFIILGILHVIFPKAFWYLSEGWKFKNAEPSEAALLMGRVGGVISVIIGIFVMIH